MPLHPAQLRTPPNAKGIPYSSWLMKQKLCSPADITAWLAKIERDKADRKIASTASGKKKANRLAEAERLAEAGRKLFL